MNKVQRQIKLVKNKISSIFIFIVLIISGLVKETAIFLASPVKVVKSFLSIGKSFAYFYKITLPHFRQLINIQFTEIVLHSKKKKTKAK